MAYDKNKVNFTEEEHKAAEAADRIYEAVSKAVADGLDRNDIAVVALVLQPIMQLFRYLAGGSKREFAARLVALGAMLERDNDFLEGSEGQ